MPTTIRDTIIQALSAGVVPRTGLQHIQVGRSLEVGAALRDITRITDTGSAFRLIIGEYGAGKTFFLHLVRTIALDDGPQVVVWYPAAPSAGSSGRRECPVR